MPPKQDYPSYHVKKSVNEAPDLRKNLMQKKIIIYTSLYIFMHFGYAYIDF